MSAGLRPSASLRSGVRGLIDELGGVSLASETLGIGREATARIAAGLGVRRGTMLLAEQALSKRTKKGER